MALWHVGTYALLFIHLRMRFIQIAWITHLLKATNGSVLNVFVFIVSRITICLCTRDAPQELFISISCLSISLLSSPCIYCWPRCFLFFLYILIIYLTYLFHFWVQKNWRKAKTEIIKNNKKRGNWSGQRQRRNNKWKYFSSTTEWKYFIFYGICTYFTQNI